MNLTGFSKYFCCALIVAATLALGGCDQSKEEAAETSRNVPVTKPAGKQEPRPPVDKPASLPIQDTETKKIQLVLYFPNNQGTKLVAVKREAEVAKKNAVGKYEAAVNALIDGTTAGGQTAIIPRRARLLGVKLDNGNCQVNFSGEIVKNFVGGSTGEEMLVGSVVNTLTEFPEIKTVQILVDGKPIESLSGHMDLSQPMERMRNLL